MSLQAAIRAHRAAPRAAQTRSANARTEARMRLPNSLSRIPGQLQRKPISGRYDVPGIEAAQAVGATEQELVRGGSQLPDGTRRLFEARLGQDLSHARVHRGDRAVEVNAALSSRAFTYRNHIWLGPKETGAPSRTMAHEVAHVLQQAPATSRRQAGAAPAAKIAAAPPSIQRDLTPPGNCKQWIHDTMQVNVKAWCDHASGRSCAVTDSCDRLRQKIMRNQMCAAARRLINVTCYEGGDAGHRKAEREAGRAQATCNAFYVAKKCTKPKKKKKPRRSPRKIPKGFMEKMAALTGLSGAALIAYIVVSEGSRLFPPRNLIPVP